MTLIELPQGVTLKMVPILGGSFMIGSPEDELNRFPNEGPQHQVTLSEFLMGKYPITQAEWRAVASLSKVDRELDLDPSYFKGDNRPVERVNWFDAMEFCLRLSVHTGNLYTLPSEAQWEYACRARTTTPFHFGETITPELANYKDSYTYAGEYRKQTSEVDNFSPNDWGLYDMHGNVWEWCLDHWHPGYEGAPDDGGAWVIGGNSDIRIVRGGSWTDNPRYCRCACRSFDYPGYRDFNRGFRVVSVPPKAL